MVNSTAVKYHGDTVITLQSVMLKKNKYIPVSKLNYRVGFDI